MCWNRALLVHHISSQCAFARRVCALRIARKHARGEILCRRLEWEQGAVSSRVASLLRSAEAKPMFYRFVRHRRTPAYHAMEVCTVLHPPLPLSCQLPPHFLLSYLREYQITPSLHSVHKSLCTCSIYYIIPRMWTHEHTDMLYIAYPPLYTGNTKPKYIFAAYIYRSVQASSLATLCVCVRMCACLPARTTPHQQVSQSVPASPPVSQSVS